MARFLRARANELDQPWLGRSAPGGPAGSGVRWNGADLLIGRTLWRGIDEATRVSFEFAGDLTRIRADPDGDYKVRFVGDGAARIGCIRAWRIGQWGEGWRPGHVKGRAIIFEIEATRG